MRKSRERLAIYGVFGAITVIMSVTTRPPDGAASRQRPRANRRAKIAPPAAAAADAAVLRDLLAEHRANAPAGAGDDLSPVAMAGRMRELGTDAARALMFEGFARNLWAAYYDLLLEQTTMGRGDGGERGEQLEARRRGALGDLEFYLGRVPTPDDALAFLNVASVPESVAALVRADVARRLPTAT